MLISNFSCGELSENLNGRVDIPQYYQGASRLENFEVIPTGGINRRSGLKRCGRLSGNCRLIPFIVNKNTSFILEFVSGRIYVWKNGEKLKDNSENQIFITTEYETLSEINEIHYAQNYNELIFVHKKYKPYKLVYNVSLESFTGGSMTFDFYPDVQLDDDYDFIIIAGAQLPELQYRGDGLLSFYDVNNKYHVFKADEKPYCVYNGKLYYWNADGNAGAIGWTIEGADPDTDFTLFGQAGKYPGSVTFFGNRLWFAGSENEPQKIWASATPDTEGNRYNDFTTYQKFVTVTKVVKNPDIHIFTGNILLANIDSVHGETTITDVTQDLTATGVLEKPATMYYCSNSTYIPVGTKVKAVYSNRIVLDVDLSSIVTEDLNSIVFTIQLWRNVDNASADDYEFQISSNNITTSDCSFNFEIASDHNDAIKFIAANKYLTVGTESSIWNIPAGVTALNIQADMSGRYGSDDIQGQAIGNAMCFFAQGKFGIRETYYQNDQEAFVTNNIAILAEQMLKESPAVDFDFMVNPYNRIVIVRDDGKAVTMLYDKTNGIMAWNRLTHGGELRLESCAIVRGNRQCDIVYFSVKDGDYYYLEQFDENNSVYLDSFQEYDAETAEDYGDNAVVFNQTTGVITPILDFDESILNESDTVYIGYMYESVIISMPVISQDPTSKKRITTLLIRFLESYMPEMICDESTEVFTDVEEPYSGIKSIDFAGNNERDVKFKLTTDKPNPCKILSINAVLA